MSGLLPDGPQFQLILEELRQGTIEALQELSGGHGPPISTPEGRGHHVLEGPLFSVSQLDFGLGDLLAFGYFCLRGRFAGLLDGRGTIRINRGVLLGLPIPFSGR